MTQKIEIKADSLYELVYIWVKFVGKKRMTESMDKESFEQGAFVFLDKIRELLSDGEEIEK